MTDRRLTDLELPLPPPPTFNYPRETPPKPPSIAPPPLITPNQETPLPDAYDTDDFYLPDADDSNYDTDSTTDSSSESLTSNISFLSLPTYDDMSDLDDLDELNFSDLEEDDPTYELTPPGQTYPMR